MGFNQHDDYEAQKKLEFGKWLVEKVIVPITIALIGAGTLIGAVSLVAMIAFDSQITIGDTIIGIGGGSENTPVPSIVPSMTSTVTSTPDNTVTLQPTKTFTPIPTNTNTPTVTSTFTPTPTATYTLTTTPTSTHTFTPIPTATSFQQYYPLSLVGGDLWGIDGNLGLTAIEGAQGTAIRELLGIPFEIGRDVSTFGCSAGSTNVVALDAIVPNPENVYVLIQAGEAYSQFAGVQLGYIQVGFDDGSSISVDLILGDNIRDWTRNSSQAVTTITSNQTIEAWRGSAQGREGGIDMITLSIPAQYRTKTLVVVSIVDTTNFSGTDPCIHLQAVTVESGR